MIQSVFSIFDAKAAAFMQPFFSVNEATARRAVAQALLAPDSMLGKFPEDYTLMRVGMFDDEKGQLHAVELPTVVCPVAALREVSHG